MSNSEPDSPFYSTFICTETALAVNFASSILAPVSFSPLSRSFVLIYPLFPHTNCVDYGHIL